MTHLSGFSDALFYISLFALIIPLANILFIPVLAVLIHRGHLGQSVWRKILVINGVLSLVPSWFFLAVILRKYIHINTLNDSGFDDFASSVFPYIGYVLQTVFFVAWLVIFSRKKEPSNRFYKAWGFCFALFYFLPIFAFLTFIAVSFILQKTAS